MEKITATSLCLFLLIGLGQKAGAQDTVGQLLKDAGKDIILDPTTYIPNGVYFTAKKLDWDSSQVFFRNGYVEENSDYTISGKAKDIPISYSAGNRRIFMKTLPILGSSVLNNAAVSISERILIHYYPNHRKLIKSIGWIEKIASASYYGYKYSNSFSQWQTNKDLSRQLGLK